MITITPDQKVNIIHHQAPPGTRHQAPQLAVRRKTNYRDYDRHFVISILTTVTA